MGAIRRSRLQGGNEEAGVRLRPLKPGEARGPRRWYPVRPRDASGQSGAGNAAAAEDEPQRRRRQASIAAGHSALWAAQRGQGLLSAQQGQPFVGRHARYLARDRAQHEVGRGLGFNAGRDDLDIAVVIRDWERGDDLMWSIVVSPKMPARSICGSKCGTWSRG